METQTEGLATRVAHENTLRMILDPKTGIDDFILVADEEMAAAVRLLLEHTRNVPEMGGAASLACAIKIRARPRRRKSSPHPQWRKHLHAQVPTYPGMMMLTRGLMGSLWIASRRPADGSGGKLPGHCVDAMTPTTQPCTLSNGVCLRGTGPPRTTTTRLEPGNDNLS